MKTYLVDFENVNSKGLVGIDKLGSDDNVIIFYSENSDTISFEMHCQVLKAKAHVEYMKVTVGGKNALDFQLSTLLGYIVANGKNTHVFVISGDKGFDKLHDFWENTFPDSPGCVVFRTNNISTAINYARAHSKPGKTEPAAVTAAAEIPTPNDAAPETAPGKVVEIIPSAGQTDPLSEMIPNVSDDEREFLIDLIADSGSKVELHEQLIKKAGSERGTYLYDLVKNRYYTLKNEFSQAKNKRSEKTAPDMTVEKTSAAPQEDKAETAPAEQDKNEKNNSSGAKEEDKIAAKKVTPSEKKKLHALVDSILSADEFSQLVAMFNSSYSVHKLKVNLMQRFGKERGNDIYLVVRPEFTAFISAQEENSAPQKEILPEQNEEETTAAKATADEKKKLHALLDDISDNNEFSGIVEQFNSSETAQQLYINLMQRFGQEKGRKFYHVIKPEFMAHITSCENTSENAAVKKKRTAKKKPEKKKAAADSTQVLLDELKKELSSDSEINKLRSCVSQSDSPHSLYLSLIKGFGKSRGTEIYNKIKKEHNSLKSLILAQTAV